MWTSPFAKLTIGVKFRNYWSNWQAFFRKEASCAKNRKRLNAKTTRDDDKMSKQTPSIAVPLNLETLPETIMLTRMRAGLSQQDLVKELNISPKKLHLIEDPCADLSRVSFSDILKVMTHLGMQLVMLTDGGAKKEG